MSWHPTDLVSESDLTAYESQVGVLFGDQDWSVKLARAIEDWLWPAMRGHALDPLLFRTRFAPDLVYGYTSAVYTDVTSAVTSETADDLNLATTLAASSDYLYIGSTAPFRGVWFRLLEAVSTAAATLSVAYWAGAWAAPGGVTDRTMAAAGKPFSGGGSITWDLPPDWTPRTVNSLGPYYWVRLSLSAAPTGAKTGQVGVLRRSVFAPAVLFRTLALIFRGAPAGQDGPWTDRAEYYEAQADSAMERAWPLAGGEFDTDADELVSATEAATTTAEAATTGPWRLERA